MKEEVLARDFDLGFSGNSDDVVMHAIHLLGNCVNITNTSRNNEFFITPSTTIPAVFELNFYSNGVLHVFIREAIIGMWGLPRKDFLVTHEVKIPATTSPTLHFSCNLLTYISSLPASAHVYSNKNNFKVNLVLVCRMFHSFFSSSFIFLGSIHVLVTALGKALSEF